MQINMYFCNCTNTGNDAGMLGENYIELEAVGLTQGVSLQEAYILVLKEAGGERHMPALVGKKDFLRLQRAMTKGEFPTTGLMSRLAKAFGISLDHVLLLTPHDGRSPALLTFEQDKGYQTLETDVATAVMAAMENHCPIYTYRALFERQYGSQTKDGQVAIPISVMSRQLLEEALQAAVKEENFELASLLRDELKGRGKAGGGDRPQS